MWLLRLPWVLRSWGSHECPPFGQGACWHLLVAGAEHAAVAGHAAEVHTVVVVAEYAAEFAAVVWPFWFSSAFGLNVVKRFADFIQRHC